MQVVVILLLLLNMALFTFNVVLPFMQGPNNLPPTERDIASFELVDTLPPYESGTAQSESSCYTLGPYANRAVAQGVMARIRRYGLAVSMRALKQMETVHYLVYIPAQANRAAALEVTADLEANDVTDYFVIIEGPYANAISLGFFNELDKAKRHTEYIRYLGYDARYMEQKTARELFWLDYDEPFGQGTPALRWSQQADSTGRFQLIPRACQ